ncbi:MAG: pyridoxal phosphate-dependent aminotransferase [Muribaculaceae bacterium]|nr:pyridoxal phosphate-dependent aminotransferase [Muribaculaceae bacterium]MCM1441410.1 pyridoxal phosphate-dependent aminotransferase [Roseburia sp.]MCM1491603.1 pyridoxal phosphate-dependent aminotransferase [Muribaculaceae bacterium]
MKRFNTSIKELMEAQKDYNSSCKEKAIFLSDWNAELEKVMYPSFDLGKELYNKSAIGNYHYWTDELNYKSHFQQCFQDLFHAKLSNDNFLIGNNGSSAIMLSLMALKELGIDKILAFTPIYYSVIKLFEMLDYQMYRFDLKIENDFEINVEQLEDEIVRNNIEAIYITDPIFSSGIEISPKIYNKICDLCRKHNTWIVIDYIYGGMNWNANNYIISNKITHIINNFSNYIVIESIAKRLFINGIKTATVFSTPQIIKKISRLSIYTVGSMCCLQLHMLREIYNTKNANVINSVIKENIIEASKRFNQVLSFTRGKNCIISPCNCSYFFLMGIPYPHKVEDMNYAINILNQTGVLTVPHSRYLLSNNQYYIFRINLLINKQDLFEGLSKISGLI